MTSLMLALLLSCDSTDPRTDQLEAQVAELTGRLSAMENEVDRLRTLVAEQTPAPTPSRTSSEPTVVTNILSRTLIDEMIDDPDKAARSARIIPHRDSNSDLDGYRLSGIRRSSPLAIAGLRNGDIIHAISGHSLADPDIEPMTVLNDLKGQDELTFDLTRRGTRSTLNIKVE
jgi:type II secretory pathway component PulC